MFPFDDVIMQHKEHGHTKYNACSTVSQVALSNGQELIIQLLLAEYVDVGVTTNNGSTPLVIACIEEHLGIKRLFAKAKFKA